MSKILNYFNPQPSHLELPEYFPSLDNVKPHPLVIKAADGVKNQLETLYSLHKLNKNDEAKMFGVLVVKDIENNVGYLAAYSGLLFNLSTIDSFVPPVFDDVKYKQRLLQAENDINKINIDIASIETDPLYLKLSIEKDLYQKACEYSLLELKASLSENKLTRDRERKKVSISAKETAVLNFQSQQDKRRFKNFKYSKKEILAQYQSTIERFYLSPILKLKEARQNISKSAQIDLFNTYDLVDLKNQRINILDLFIGELPPSGTADCAAPKLLNYAFKNQLMPLALGEFWWGKKPTFEVRQHGHFYMPCKSRCQVILPNMLKGLTMEDHSSKISVPKLEPTIIYEDESIILIDKPPNMLSIPGKNKDGSVQSWLTDYLKGEFVLLLHRLDQATSGLLLAAKDKNSHFNLQKQFINRTIHKRYVAVLSKPVKHSEYLIDLPLSVDLTDRPRQIVNYKQGKSSQSKMVLINIEKSKSRVYFYPITGRTHQLRVHAAHLEGLNNPIVGDKLYGEGSSEKRLMLHAEKLTFEHPKNNQIMVFRSKAPF